MKIKVCGMKYIDNIVSLGELKPDLTGLIFYKASKRFIGETLSPGDLLKLNADHEFAGVFVNDSVKDVLRTVSEYGLSWVQLHGEESPEECRLLRQAGLNVVKAIPVAAVEDLSVCEGFHGAIDYFLFDTRSEQRGGTGKKFNWDVLEEYQMSTPFFLSGGIGPGDAQAILDLEHEMLYGVDVNSGFETEPGLKNIELLESFIHEIRDRNGNE